MVVGGSPERSNLFQKVASTAPPCGEQMPTEESLTSAEIDCVADYIRSLAGSDPVEECQSCGGLLCIDEQSDPLHCGACDTPCADGQICSAGVCEGCSEGTNSCDGECVDLQLNSKHCGACGVVCGGGQSCVAGMCECGANTNVSFATDVQPILTRDCTTGCHESTSGGPSPGGKPEGVGKSTDPILSAESSYDALVGVPSGCNGLNHVEPSKVEESYLMKKLLGIEMCGGSRMPKGQAVLSQEDLDTIGAWICGGALDN